MSSLKPLVFDDIYEGRVFQTPHGNDDSWTINAPFEDGFRHEIKYLMGVPDGQDWADWITMNRPEKFDPGNDAHRWYHAHSSSQDIASAHSIEGAKDLIDRIRLGRDRDWLAIITAAGFKERWKHTYHDGKRNVTSYKIDIGKKGVLTFSEEEGGANVSYDTLRGRWTSGLASVKTQIFHEYGDKLYHPVYWPESCAEPKAVLAQFTVDVIIPFVTTTRMNR